MHRGQKYCSLLWRTDQVIDMKEGSDEILPATHAKNTVGIIVFLWEVMFTHYWRNSRVTFCLNKYQDGHHTFSIANSSTCDLSLFFPTYINNDGVQISVKYIGIILFLVEWYKTETTVSKEIPELYLFSCLQITCEYILKDWIIHFFQDIIL